MPRSCWNIDLLYGHAYYHVLFRFLYTIHTVYMTIRFGDNCQQCDIRLSCGNFILMSLNFYYIVAFMTFDFSFNDVRSFVLFCYFIYPDYPKGTSHVQVKTWRLNIWLLFLVIIEHHPSVQKVNCWANHFDMFLWLQFVTGSLLTYFSCWTVLRVSGLWTTGSSYNSYTTLSPRSQCPPLAPESA